MENNLDHSASRHVRAIRSLLLFTALAAQTVIVARHSGSFIIWFLATTGIIALSQSLSGRSKSRLAFELNKVLAMTLIGGVGMALGELIDSLASSSAPCTLCRTHSLLSWSNGLMLAFCFFACQIDRSHNGALGIARLWLDGLCMFSMITGMALGHIFLLPLLGRTNSDSLGMHGIMILGMFLGNILGLVASRSLMNIRPSARVSATCAKSLKWC